MSSWIDRYTACGHPLNGWKVTAEGIIYENFPVAVLERNLELIFMFPHSFACRVESIGMLLVENGFDGLMVVEGENFSKISRLLPYNEFWRFFRFPSFSTFELNGSVYCLWKSVELLTSYCWGIYRAQRNYRAYIFRSSITVSMANAVRCFSTTCNTHCLWQCCWGSWSGQHHALQSHRCMTNC